MESGNIVEYIDSQKIICAVVLEVKKQRLRLLTENNREVNLSTGRLSHQCRTRLGLSMGRDKLVQSLKETVNRRKALMDTVDIEQLWEVLNTEREWIDLATMTEFCFSGKLTGDHEAAVVRAFFQDRIYFKFNSDRFFPNSEEQIEKIHFQAKEADRKKRIVEEGANWLKNALNNPHPLFSQDISEVVEILKSYYLFEKESKHSALGKAILARAGVDTGDRLFRLFVKLGVWDENENLNLYRCDVPTSFPSRVMDRAEELMKMPEIIPCDNTRRHDLESLSIMTIDGRLTFDYDDALSVEKDGDNYRIGVHIVDVAHFIKKGNSIDEQALARGSSIYMPDRRIPMIPPCLSEDLCSLNLGELRPAVSIFARLSPFAEVIDFEIVPSLIRVKRRLTYNEVNTMITEDEQIKILYELAKLFRQKRMASGAVHISLPEINIWLSEDGQINIKRIDREGPGRMLVAEMMIMANWLMARFLAENNTPAIFRSQPEPRSRLIKNNEEGTLFENWMQRRHLSRGILGPNPEYHSGLGLNAYTTATSPIRKYFDLATQRQIRSVLGLEKPYSSEEIKHIIQILQQPMSSVAAHQFLRQRYWLLKYLEGQIGKKEKAIVLDKRRDSYTVLLPEYMMECGLPQSSSAKLKPKDIIQVTIQHASARNDVLSIFMG